MKARDWVLSKHNSLNRWAIQSLASAAHLLNWRAEPFSAPPRTFSTQLNQFITLGVFILLLVLGSAGHAQTSPQGIALQGHIVNASGVVEESASVNFIIQIRSPGLENCVLYQENQTLNMTASGGVFALTIGSGSRTGGSGFEFSSTLKIAFSNAQPSLTGLNCASGSTYTAVSGDKRKLILTFNDGTGGAQSITQALDVGAVPYALYADTLQGKLPGDFINVNNTTAVLTQANLESIFLNAGNVSQLSSLISGTSSNYAKSSATGGTSIQTTSGAPATLTQGAMWFDTGTGKLNYYDGTATQVVGASGGSGSGITSLNGLTTTTQTFSTPSTTGTAPAWSSSGSAHTLSIPLASGAEVTAGLVGNTDYSTWSKSILKDGSIAFTADQSMGAHKLTNVTDPVAATDAATRNYSDLHVAGKNLVSTIATDVSGSAGAGYVLTWDQVGNQWKALAPSTTGSVTSVGLSLPGIFNVTNSPVTSSGTLTASLANESANLIFAGPSSGGAATPAFRSLASADLPTTLVAKGGTGSTSQSPNGIIMASGDGSTLMSSFCATGEALVAGSSTTWGCQSVATGTQATQWTTTGSNVSYSTGNVGIGIASPLAPLEISQDTGPDVTGIGLRLNSVSGSNGNGLGILWTNNGDVLNLAVITGQDDDAWGGRLIFMTAPQTGGSPGGTPTERILLRRYHPHIN